MVRGFRVCSVLYRKDHSPCAYCFGSWSCVLCVCVCMCVRYCTVCVVCGVCVYESMCSVCVCRKGPGAHKKRDRARRGPGRRTFINSKIPGPEGTAPQDAVACRTRNDERAAPPLQQNGWRQKQQQRLSISRAPVRVQRVPSGATYTSCVSHGQQQTHGNTKRAMRIVMRPQCFSMV